MRRCMTADTCKSMRSQPDMLTYLFRMSTSAFLQARLENLLPIPLIAVMANIIFCLPSTLVFSTRRMC